MKTSTYLRRVAKYIVQLSVIFIFVFGIMMMLNKNASSANFAEIYFNQRGLLLLGVIVAFALAYPFFGFTKKTLTFDVVKHDDDVDNVMNMCGFTKTNSDNQVITYRAKTAAKKFMLMYEDTITITNIDSVWIIEGARKEVVRAYMRFDTFITLNQ